MSFPRVFNEIQFAPETILVYKDDVIIFVHKGLLAIINGETLVWDQGYRSHAYARADAQRAALKIGIGEMSPTEVRRELAAATDRGKLGDVKPGDFFS